VLKVRGKKELYVEKILDVRIKAAGSGTGGGDVEKE
jgi:hypothetical protein